MSHHEKKYCSVIDLTFGECTIDYSFLYYAKSHSRMEGFVEFESIWVIVPHRSVNCKTQESVSQVYINSFYLYFLLFKNVFFMTLFLE